MKRVLNALLIIITTSSFASSVISCNQQNNNTNPIAHSITGPKLNSKSNIASASPLENYVMFSKADAIYIAHNGTNIATTPSLRYDSNFKEVKGYYNQNRYILIAAKFGTGIEIITTNTAEKKVSIYDYQYKYNVDTDADSIISSKERIWFITRPSNIHSGGKSHVYFINKRDLNNIPVTNKTGDFAPSKYKPVFHEVQTRKKTWGDSNIYIYNLSYAATYDEIFISTNEGCYYISNADLYSNSSTHYNEVIHSLDTNYANVNIDNSPYIKIKYDPNKTKLLDYIDDIKRQIKLKLENVDLIWSMANKIQLYDNEKDMKINIPSNSYEIWKHIDLKLLPDLNVAPYEVAPSAESNIYENVLFYKSAQDSQSIANKINKTIYLKYKTTVYTPDDLKKALKLKFALTDEDLKCITIESLPPKIDYKEAQTWTITIDKNNVKISAKINVWVERSQELLNRIKNKINAQKDIDYLKIYEINDNHNADFYNINLKANLRDLCDLSPEEIQSLSIDKGQSMSFSDINNINISSNLEGTATINIKVGITRVAHYVSIISWKDKGMVKIGENHTIHAYSKIFLDDSNHILWTLIKNNKTKEFEIFALKEGASSRYNTIHTFTILSEQPLVHLSYSQSLRNIVFYKNKIIFDVYDDKTAYGSHFNSFIGSMEYEKDSTGVLSVKLNKNIISNNNNFNNILISSTGLLWLGTNNKGAFYIKLSDTNSYYNIVNFPKNAYVRGILESTDKEVWIYTTNNGIWRISI